MSLEENPMILHVSIHRATCTWAIVLGLVVLVMVSPVNAQPVDIPATWGRLRSRPRLTGSRGGLRDGFWEERRQAGTSTCCCRRSRAWQRRAERSRDVLGLAEYTLNVDTQEARPLAGRFPARSGGLSSFGQNINHGLRGPHLAQLSVALA